LITSGGIVDIQMMAVWKCNNPLKVKNFLWMAADDRIQSGVHLKKRQWSGPKNYKVCDKLETTDHILFQFPIAVFLWPYLIDVLGWTRLPTSCSEFFLLRW